MRRLFSPFFFIIIFFLIKYFFIITFYALQKRKEKSNGNKKYKFAILIFINFALRSSSKKLIVNYSNKIALNGLMNRLFMNSAFDIKFV